jgi:hypothetical protein
MTTNFVTKPPRVEHCRGANIHMQLWLRIFTASSIHLRKDYFLFSNGTPSKARAARDGICHSYNRGKPCPLRPNCPYTHRCNRIGCGENHPGYQCPQSRGENDHNENHTSQSVRIEDQQKIELLVKSVVHTIACSNSIPLDNTIVTSIRVDAHEDALRGHPDSSFVLKLCSDLRFDRMLASVTMVLACPNFRKT